MTTVSSVKDVRNSKISVQVAVISMLLVPVAGVSCLLFPALAEEALPWYLGVPMVVSAIGSIVAVARERDADAGREGLGSAIVLCVLGLVIIVHGANSTVLSASYGASSACRKLRARSTASSPTSGTSVPSPWRSRSACCSSCCRCCSY